MSETIKDHRTTEINPTEECMAAARTISSRAGATEARQVFQQCMAAHSRYLPHVQLTGTGGEVQTHVTAPPTVTEQLYLEAKEASSPNIPYSRMLSETKGLFGTSNPAPTNIGAEIEARAYWHGDRHALTPLGLGSEGCMIADSVYASGPALKARGINTLDVHGNINPPSGGQDVEKILDTHFFLQAVSRAQADTLTQNRQTVDSPVASVTLIRQDDLGAEDLKPGDVVVGVKSTSHYVARTHHIFEGHDVSFDYHASIATRIPSSWGNYPGGMMLVGNTGLDMTNVAGGGPHDPNSGKPGTAPHFRTAQEVIGQNTEKLNSHHGQLNSQSMSNPYLGGYFYVVRFHDR